MDNNEISNIEITSEAARYCYLCYAPLDTNKACTNAECELYGIPQE